MIRTLGRDAATGYLVSTDTDTGERWYVTDCCRASAKGSTMSPTGVCCRACYAEIDPGLGGIVPTTTTLVPEGPTMTDRTPTATADLVPFDDTLTLPEITVGMLVEMADLTFETPANQRKWGGVWKVQEISARSARYPVNIVNPMGTRAGVAPSQIKRSTRVWTEVEAAEVTLGTVVPWKNPAKGADATDRLVVLKVTGDVVNLAKLGGNGGKFSPSLPRSRLTVVTGETVTIP